MAFKIITIPFDPVKEIFFDDDLNNFLLNKNLLNWKADFFRNHNKYFWTVFIEYSIIIDQNNSKQKKPVEISETQQLLLKKLKEWRVEKAQERGIPSYIIATNSELKLLVTIAPKSLEALRQIRGFGKKKVENYGKELIKMISTFYKSEK